MDIALKQRLHWLALHGFVRGLSSIGARRGDLQARLIADPTVKADPVPFYEEVRARDDLLHPLRPPSLLAVEPPRTTPATGKRCHRCSPHGRSPHCAMVSSGRR